MSIWMSMLAPGRNRAQFLTANRNTQVLGRTPSYDLRSRRATADPLYVFPTRTGLQKPAWCATNNVISLPVRTYDSTVALPGHGRSIENPLSGNQLSRNVRRRRCSPWVCQAMRLGCRGRRNGCYLGSPLFSQPLKRRRNSLINNSENSLGSRNRVLWPVLPWS
jgi:hypothetical protein